MLQECRRAALKSVQAQDGTHPGLWLDRFLTDQTFHQDSSAPSDYNKEAATKARSDLIAAVQEKPLPVGYEHAFRAWSEGFGLGSDGKDGSVQVVSAVAKATGRVLIGAGQKGPAEFGLTLHHTWGLPVLPGSSLKGIAAAAASRFFRGGTNDEWTHRPEAAGLRKGGPNAYDALFGDVEEAGAVIFHDAWYKPGSATGNGIVRDVLTVHHPEYYQKNRPYTETEDPVPVPMVSVRGSFLVVLGLHPSLDPASSGHWLEYAWRALELGLRELGVGSKTNAGYGRLALPAFDDTNWGQRARDGERRATRAALDVPGRLRHLLADEGEGVLREWLCAGGPPPVGFAGDAEEIERSREHFSAQKPPLALDPSLDKVLRDASAARARRVAEEAAERRFALSPEHRIADVLKHEGAGRDWWFKEWVREQNPIDLPGLTRDRETVAAAACLVDKRFHPQRNDVPMDVWEWISAAATRPAMNTGRSISGKLLDEKVLKTPAAWPNRRRDLAEALAKGGVNPDHVQKAYALLKQIGASEDELAGIREKYPDVVL